MVKPDIVSKKAATGCGITPDRMYGRAPNSAAKIQPKVTTPKPSRLDRLISPLVKNSRIRANTAVITDDVSRLY